jgi:N4-gp56 family major capsid protein
MTDTTLATGLRVQQWLDKFFTEYLTENRYAESMGPDENSIFHVKEDLTKKAGDSITFSLVNKLTGSAITGSSTLEGNEEGMDTRSFRLYIDKRRNAVRIAEMETVKSPIDLMNAGRSVLKDWSMKDTEGLITTALASINGVAYGSASEAQKDAWLVDNADRVLFGATKSNNSSNDHSASLANIDATTDKLTPAALSLMKRIALTASPKITPIRVEKTSGKRFYVVYANPLSFRDLKDNATMTAAQREVGLQAENNRLFQGGDLLWDGMVIKEVEDIDVLANVGAGGTVDVGPVYLCGAQAVAIAYGKRWKDIKEDFDYGDKKVIGVEGIMGVAKTLFGTGPGDTDDQKDHGVVTAFFSAEPDA